MPATTANSLLADLNDANHRLSIPLKTYLPEQLAELRLHATHLLQSCCTEQCLVELHGLVDSAYANMSSSSTSIPRHAWMRLHSDASILASLYNLSSSNAKHSISVLDRCIIVSGPGGGRLELILALIRSIQAEYLTVTPRQYSPLGRGDEPVILPLSAQEITTFSCPPSIFSFQCKYYDRPFLLRAYASDWPALNAHSWSSRAYLLSVSGPGRVVPVEIGNDYRQDTWKQSFVDWEDFLALLEPPQRSSPSEVRYLAQYNLFMQFPGLRDDIVIPDYVYTSISPLDLPGYAPPRNDEQLVINVWLGPKATFTPPHTDPHCNMYVQVVGRKTVWLAPPKTTQWMYSYGQANNVSRDSEGATGSSLLENTSRVDVFSDSEESRQHYPDFWSHVVPHAMAATLEPGDLLYIPAGWWHSMRSEQPQPLWLTSVNWRCSVVAPPHMSALDESPIFLKSKAFSTSLNHDHISQAIQRSSDMGATLIFSKMSLTDVGTEAAEELATIGRVTPEDESIVERIALRNNRLTTLPMEFALLSRLRYLNLRCNCLTVFPDVLTLLPALDTLDLSHNKIKRLPADAGQLVCLRVFCLSRNRIAKLPSYIANFHNLEILRIDRNPIEWPPRTVSDYVGDPESKKTVMQWVKNLQDWMRNDASRSKDSEDLTTPADPDLTTSEGSTSSLNAAERPTVPEATSIAHSRSVSIDSMRSFMSSDSLQGSTPSSPLPKSLGQPALHLGILRSYGGEISPTRSFDSLLPSPADSSASFGDKTVPNPRHGGIGRSQDDLDRVVSVNHATMLSAAPFGHKPDETSGWSDTHLNGSGIYNAQDYHDDISISQPTSLGQRIQLRTPSPDIQPSVSTEVQHSSSWAISSMTLQRNSYFRRLSKLPTMTALPRPLTHLVDFARSILFALCQVFQTLEHYASYAADERLSAILRKVLGPANTDLLNLIRCLDRFDTMSHRHIPSSPVCRALVESCRDTTTVFNKAVGVLALQLRVIATGDDVQYARWILLELYAATAEISCAWQNVAPQRESIRPYLHAKPINFQVLPVTPGMNGSDSLSTSSSAERSQLAELAPIRGTDATTYNIGRTRTSRRHAGSFSSKDVEIGKSLPSYDDIPMSQGRILSGPATKVPVLRTPKRQATVPQPTVPTPWSSTSDAGFFGDATRFAHSRRGSQTSFQHQEPLTSALPKSPFGELSSTSKSQVDKEALLAIKQAVDIAPKVWNMIESLVSKIPHPEPSVEEKLRTARTVTRRLSEAVRLMEDVEVVADRTILRDDAHLFLKMVVQLSSVIKSYGERQPVSTSLRNNMVKLTNSTEEFAILLHVSSFSPSIPRPYRNTHNDSVTLPHSEEKYLGSSLSRNRGLLTGTDLQMPSKRRP